MDDLRRKVTDILRICLDYQPDCVFISAALMLISFPLPVKMDSVNIKKDVPSPERLSYASSLIPSL